MPCVGYFFPIGVSKIVKISTNSFPPEAVGNNAFHYAQNDPNGIQARWNREHGIIS